MDMISQQIGPFYLPVSESELFHEPQELLKKHTLIIMKVDNISSTLKWIEK